MEAIERLGGCLRTVIGDWGTENVKVTGLQRFLHRNIHDSSAIDSYIEGQSLQTKNRKLVGLLFEGLSGVLHVSVCS